MNKFQVYSLLLSAIIFFCLTTKAQAEDGCASWFCYDGENWKGSWETGMLRVGGAFADIDSKLRVGLGDINTQIDLEDQAGLEDSLGLFRVGATFRYSRRHRFDFEYYKLDRDGTTRLRAGINIDDDFIGIDEIINTELDLDVFKMTYQFNWWKTDNIEIGLLAGVWLGDLSYSVKAPGVGVAEARDDTAPLPVLGLRATNALTDKLQAFASVEIFSIELGDYEGNLVDSRFGAEYNIWKYIGVGLEFNVVTADIENNDRDDFNGRLDLSYFTFGGYAKFYF